MTNGDIVHKAEVDAILSGGRPEVDRFLVESVIQLKHGQAKQHELLEDHCVEANVRDTRLEVLEAWRHEQATTCEKRVRDLIESEHETRHNAYVASVQPSEVNAKLVWFFATTAGKLMLIAAGAIIATLVNVLVYGRP